MPPLHPLVIHFPIALFVVAVLFDVITTFTRKTSLVAATRILMVFSAVGTIIAILTGEILKAQRGAFLPPRLLALHQTLAIIFGVYALILTFVRVKRTWKPTVGYISWAGVAVVLLVAVGHTGGEMAWPALPAPAKTSAQVGSSQSQNSSGKQTASTVGTKGSAGTQTGQPKVRHQASADKAGRGSKAANKKQQASASNPSTTTVSASSSSTSGSAASNKVLMDIGSQGTAVSQLQQALTTLGVFQHTITQYYGPITAQGVSAFQAQNGLAQTGKLDEKTLQAIEQSAGVTIQIDSSTVSSSGSSSGSSASSAPDQSASAASTQTASTAGSSSSASGGSASNSSGSSNTTSSSTTSVSTNSQTTTSVDQVRYQNGYNAFVQNCQSCHSLGLVEGYYGQYSSSWWQSVVDTMQSYAGGTIPNTSDIVYYLSQQK